MNRQDAAEETGVDPDADATGTATTDAGRRRGCLAVAAIIAVVCAGVIAVAYFTLRAWPSDPGVDIDHVQQMLDADGTAMETHAKLVLATAAEPTKKCAPQQGAPPPTTPPVPIAGGVRVWCTREIDPTSLWRSVVEVDGVDPAKRCLPGATFVVFDVPEATWGTPYVVFSDQCAPTSWYDGDPSYGRNFVPLRGPWYAVQPTGGALIGVW